MKKTAKKLAASIGALVFALCLAVTGMFAWFCAGDAVTDTNGSFSLVCAVAYLTEKDYDRTIKSVPVCSETDTASEELPFEGGTTYTLTVANFSLGAVKLSFSAEAPVYFEGTALKPKDAFTLSETGGHVYAFELTAQTDCAVTMTIAAA